MRLPVGFRAAGVSAGLKRSGRSDLGLLLVDAEAAWALTSTRNRLRAACVERNSALLQSGRAVRAVAVNSGNANCATGEQGARDNEAFAAAAAAELGLPAPQEVLTASTGVVGQPLPLERIEAGLPRAAAALEGDSAAFARAILTTDTVTKEVAVDLPGGARVVGVAKGSGMIHPDMATMLAFVLTDAAVPQRALRELWSRLVDRSFNQVTVDTDTSPNDMALVLSSGRRAAAPEALAAALDTACRALARQIARDGEGASKLLTVVVSGAADARQARLAARAVAASPLVKAAVHGRDPNWGRILAAAGRSGASFEPSLAVIALQGEVVYHGAPLPFDAAKVSRSLDAEEVVIAIDLGRGSGRGESWGCDLSAEYVRINADYTT